jgi:threonine/homoserine efflux transporter RhtA
MAYIIPSVGGFQFITFHEVFGLTRRHPLSKAAQDQKTKVTSAPLGALHGSNQLFKASCFHLFIHLQTVDTIVAYVVKSSAMGKTPASFFLGHLFALIFPNKD